MFWIAAKVGIPRERIVLAACDCAELALQHVPANEDRPRIAIATSRRWALGRETIANVKVAAADAHAAVRDAAYDAICAAARNAYAAAAVADAAAHAAHAAASAADAVDDANFDTDTVVSAADTVLMAASTRDAADAERVALLSRCADNVRRYISFSDIEKSL